MTSDPPFEFGTLRTDPDGWLYVAGGGLVQPVEVKFRIAGTSVVVVGVRIDNEAQVGTAALRSIRLGELGAQLWRYIQAELARADDAVGDDEELPTTTWNEYNATMAGAWTLPPGELAAWEWVEMAAARDSLRRWIDSLSVPNDVAITSRGRGATPPSDDEYRAFAKAYLEQLVDQAHGAKSRTGRQLGMDRSTVYRWIEECQRRGFLPTDDGGTK
jgi:hypothetical protein